MPAGGAVGVEGGCVDAGGSAGGRGGCATIGSASRGRRGVAAAHCAAGPGAHCCVTRVSTGVAGGCGYYARAAPHTGSVRGSRACFTLGCRWRRVRRPTCTSPFEPCAGTWLRRSAWMRLRGQRTGGWRSLRLCVCDDDSGGGGRRAVRWSVGSGVDGRAVRRIASDTRQWARRCSGDVGWGWRWGWGIPRRRPCSRGRRLSPSFGHTCTRPRRTGGARCGLARRRRVAGRERGLIAPSCARCGGGCAQEEEAGCRRWRHGAPSERGQRGRCSGGGTRVLWRIGCGSTCIRTCPACQIYRLCRKQSAAPCASFPA